MRARAIVVAAVADAILGDPRRLHPVAGFGVVARRLERILWRPQRARGVVYAVLLVGIPTLATAAACRTLGPRRRRGALAALLLWSALGGRSLGREARRLALLVEEAEIEVARVQVRSLVGRDSNELDRAGLCRAAVESVAENTADAVVGALLWFALAGPPAVVAYRAANTLDAIVGHQSARYAEFGWASARLDDVLTWPAARLSAGLACLLAPVAGGDAARAWRTLRRDGPRHPSPNAGLLEAAFAGALGVRLGGRNAYGGRVERRPCLGDGPAPMPADVRRGVHLSVAVGWAAVAICVVLASAVEQ